MSLLDDVINFVRKIPLIVDGVGMAKALEAASASKAEVDNWWDSPRRFSQDPTKEYLEINYGTERLINYIDFEMAHFPSHVDSFYQEERTGEWYQFEHKEVTQTIAAGPVVSGLTGHGPASHTILESFPSVVDTRSAAAAKSSQHYGPNAWVPVHWVTKPVRTSKIRLVLSRVVEGTPPTNVGGQFAPYSVGVNNFQAGYQVNSIADLPKTETVQVNTDSTFAQTTDLYGSSVAYSLYQDSPDNVLSADDNAAWRCNPQPINYAVVNFFVDTRDFTGEGQVIDRFYMDPTSTGPHMNIYYSNDAPPREVYRAQDDALAYPVLNRLGAAPRYKAYYQATTGDYTEFSKTEVSVLEIDNTYLQLDVQKGWWVGLEVISSVDTNGLLPSQANDPNADTPWISLGDHYLRQKGSTLEFRTSTGAVARFDLPASHRLNTHAHVVVAYTPTDTADLLSGISIHYSAGNGTLSTSTAIPALTTRSNKIRINGYPGNSPGVGGLNLRSLVIKDAQATTADIEAFLADGTAYTATDEFPSREDQSTDNALLRINPQFVSATNTVGLVGGRREQYSDVTWTPVARDYTLRKGYVYLPPTKARYWKFEFTNLVAETYENYIEMRRSVQVFPESVVQKYQQVTQSGSWSGVGLGGAFSGVPFILSNLGGLFDYAEALTALRRQPVEGATATEVLISKDPIVFRNGLQGWIWNYRPWHVGQGAPRFTEVSKHVYEKIEVVHQDKLAFFVGLKQLTAYRVDYAADNDTLRYYDPFLDSANIDLANTTGVTFGPSMIQSAGSFGVVQSKTISSQRKVRAIQFATMQSDSHSLLPDDHFADPVLANHWRQYGDATITRRDDASVEVNRGWFARVYNTHEGRTLADLEGMTYGELEGAQSNGLAGGGIASEPLFPAASGRLFAAAQISAPAGLNGPVAIQIVAEEGGYILAQRKINLNQGGVTSLYVDYLPGTVGIPLKYSDLQMIGNYGDIEGSKYGDHESRAITGRVYARIVQEGQTTDTFSVLRLAIFDEPIEWSFSVDDGQSWYSAYDVRNKQSGVLTLPTQGKKMKWRARMFTPGATISALAIRPWYAGLLGIDQAPLRAAGPNVATHDDLPPIYEDPLWRQWDEPIPRAWIQPSIEEGESAPLPTQGDPLSPIR